MFDCFICYHQESGWHMTRPNQGLSLERGERLGTRLIPLLMQCAAFLLMKVKLQFLRDYIFFCYSMPSYTKGEFWSFQPSTVFQFLSQVLVSIFRKRVNCWQGLVCFFLGHSIRLLSQFLVSSIALPISNTSAKDLSGWELSFASNLTCKFWGIFFLFPFRRTLPKKLVECPYWDSNPRLLVSSQAW